MTVIKASGTGNWRAAFQIFPELWSYLKRPTLISVQTEWTPLVWRQLLLLIAFDILLLVPAILFEFGYEETLTVFGFDVPEHTGFDDLKSLWALLLILGVMAPVLEEPLFRGWLKGSPRQLMLLAVAVLLLSFTSITPEPESAYVRRVTALTLIFFCILCAFAIILATRKNASPVRFFERHFGAFFWLSAIGFAAMHLFNYEADNYWLVVPMVLPQFICGPIWGFARMRFGLRASILLHSASNSLLVLLAITVTFLLVA